VSPHEFLDEVRVQPIGGSEFALLDGRLGVVLGVSGPDEEPEAYAVAVDGEAELIMLSPAEIEATGLRRNKADYYDGMSLQVSPEGRILGAKHADDP
jgi:hypothetical protein